MDSTILGPTGKVYNLSPLTLGDLADFRSFVQYLPWHQLRRMKDQFKGKDFDSKLDAVFVDCTKRKVSEDDINEAFGLVDGVIELVYMSLRRNDDKITRQEVAGILTIGNSEDVARKLFLISGMTDDTGDDSKKNGKAKSR